jgi:hypothetical protein
MQIFFLIALISIFPGHARADDNPSVTCWQERYRDALSEQVELLNQEIEKSMKDGTFKTQVRGVWPSKPQRISIGRFAELSVTRSGENKLVEKRIDNLVAAVTKSKLGVVGAAVGAVFTARRNNYDLERGRIPRTDFTPFRWGTDRSWGLWLGGEKSILGPTLKVKY